MRLHDKIMFQVDRNGPVWGGTPCWIWQGPTNQGYGRVFFLGKNTGVHRYMYSYHRGDVPEGLELDHLCRNRACCNPHHLEPVTSLQNNLRGVEARKLEKLGKLPANRLAVNRGDKRLYYCKRGHLMDESNSCLTANGKRRCKQCHAEEETQAYHEKMANLTETTYQLHRQQLNAQQQAYRARLRAEQGLGPVDHSLPAHCSRGHEYTPENTRMNGNKRVCKTCHREREKARHHAKKNPHDHSDITKLLNSLLDAQPAWPSVS